MIFGGTSEGRILAEYCDREKIPALVCVATEYGSELLRDFRHIRVEEGRKDAEAMRALFGSCKAGRVYDATHPYAEAVSANIRRVCTEMQVDYVRVLRKSLAADRQADFIELESIEAAVAYLAETEGNILVATGSKDLHKYASLDRGRLFPRVLPNVSGVGACEAAGIPSANIIAMQGPFDVDNNAAQLKKYDCRYLVSKEAGDVGGFAEKIEACKRVGAKALIIKRPEEEQGISLEEALAALQKEKAGKNIVEEEKRREAVRIDVCIAGMGVGSPACMTVEVRQEILARDVIIGSARLVRTVQQLRAEAGLAPCREQVAYKPKEIADWIYRFAGKEDKILLGMSGDSGFYSGAVKLKSRLEEGIEQGFFAKDSRIRLLPGISSFSYMAAKFGIDYTDMHLVSVHGREDNLHALFDSIRYHKKTFALSSGEGQVDIILDKLVREGLGQVDVYIGQDMGYPEERYLRGKARELQGESFARLCSLMFVHEAARPKEVLFGMEDTAFLRDAVPMTKAAVRAQCMAKLELSREAVCYDVGAGTGSCSVEMARYADLGRVYAIEQKALACDLIRQNAARFSLDNIKVLEAEASAVIGELEPPTHVFIGGSSGNLRKIVDKIYAKNAEAKVVMSAITLESIGEINTLLKAYRKAGYRCDITWLSFADEKCVADYTMMMGGNPVFIGRIRAAERG